MAGTGWSPMELGELPCRRKCECTGLSEGPSTVRGLRADGVAGVQACAQGPWLCPGLTIPLSYSGAEHAAAAEHHHVHPHRPIPAARTGVRGRHQAGPASGGVLAAEQPVKA